MIQKWALAIVGGMIQKGFDLLNYKLNLYITCQSELIILVKIILLFFKITRVDKIKFKLGLTISTQLD
jgi:hypothetical protein